MPSLLSPAPPLSVDLNQFAHTGEFPVTNPKGPVAGSLARHFDAWQSHTDASPWLLRTIQKGLRLAFLKVPPPSFLTNFPFSTTESQFIRQEIQRLLEVQAIEPTSRDALTCVHRIFTVPKSSGSLRLILDCRPVNRYLRTRKFRTDDIRSLAPSLAKGTHLITLDAVQAYSHLEVVPEHRQYLGFAFEGQYYRYRTMPFGLSTAPMVWTSVMRAASSHINRVMAIPHVVFYDDLCFAFPSREAALAARAPLLDYLRSLGIHVSQEKSDLVPTPVKPYLGHIINCLGAPSIHVTPQRMAKLRSSLRRALRLADENKPLAFKDAQRLAGLCVSTTQAIVPAKLMLRSLYRDIKRTARNKPVRLRKCTQSDLQWWLDSASQWNGAFAVPPPPQSVIQTDASRTGGGMVWEQTRASWRWTSFVRRQSSNFRELMTVLIALKSLAHRVTGQAVLVQSDNMTAVSQINKFGSASPALTKLARAIHEHCWENNMHIRAEHVPGTSLEIDREGGADALSRRVAQDDFQISPAFFRKAEKLFGPHSCDAFASWTNTHVPNKFFTRYLDPSQMPVNAFLQDWSQDNLWMVPPWTQLQETVAKIRRDAASATIVVPYWPRQAWFSELLSMSIALPVPLPQHHSTFYMASSTQVDKLLRWRFFCFRVSGASEAPTLSRAQLVSFFQRASLHTH
jgi:hypothetical protein